VSRRLAVLIAVLTVAAVPAAAEARTLTIAEAKALTAKKAQKVKRELAGEGAQRARIPGCWRNSRRQVSCFFSIYGYDEELDYRWECMLRVVVRLTDSGRYAVRYRNAACG
jgi:hypothetical protein